MRSGHLLAEESPQNLLSLYALSSLEDVFLKLCMKDVGSGKHATAPVVSTISDGRAYPAIGQPDGHDNPVFAQGYGANPDAIAPSTVADIDQQHHANEDDDEAHKNLAELPIVSAVPFYLSFVSKRAGRLVTVPGVSRYRMPR